MNIATLLTCFNRKEKTLKCLSRLFSAADKYNAGHNADHRINVSVFLTDDGCMDGTSEAVTEACKDRDLHIIKGDGNLFWAGGMREAWKTALKAHERWQFYLLLNDDTLVCDNVFAELLDADNYAIKEYGRQGIYSGIISSLNDEYVITYGGDIFASQAKVKTNRVLPTGTPQLVDMTTANILLVPHDVVDSIGILAEGYVHSGADNDYCMMARRNEIPALVTAHVCGRCDYDHEADKDTCLRMAKMSLAERRLYVSHPLHSDADYLLLIRRNNIKKYPISWLLRKLRLYFPSIYLYLNKIRGIY